MTGIDLLPLRIVVADDERLARERLTRLLGSIPGVTLAAVCASGRETLEALETHAPDILLLDVQMPDLDGFGVLARLRNARTPRVIFVTAHDRHAVRAFDVHAIDYVLKPVAPERLARAVARARTAIANDAAAEAQAADGGPRDGVLVVDGGRRVMVAARDIDWIEARGNYARLHTHGGRHLVRMPMAVLAERLLPLGFVRIHRSAIVNLERIREMVVQVSGNHAVMLTNGVSLRCGRRFRAAVAAALEERAVVAPGTWRGPGGT